MIRIENLTKIFRTEEVETVALNGVSLEVKDGEFVAIMGPSGCGKSTLAKLIAGIVTPTSGQILLDGQDITGLDITNRANIGISLPGAGEAPVAPVYADGVKIGTIKGHAGEASAMAEEFHKMIDQYVEEHFVRKD